MYIFLEMKGRFAGNNPKFVLRTLCTEMVEICKDFGIKFLIKFLEV